MLHVHEGVRPMQREGIMVWKRQLAAHVSAIQQQQQQQLCGVQYIMHARAPQKQQLHYTSRPQALVAPAAQQPPAQQATHALPS